MELTTTNFAALSNDEMMDIDGGTGLDPVSIAAFGAAVAFVGLCGRAFVKGFEAGRAVVRDIRNW